MMMHFLSSGGIRMLDIAAGAIAVPEASPVALGYHAASNAFWAADKSVGLVLPAVLLLTGWGARWYAAIALRCKGRKRLPVLLFALGYFALDRGMRAIVDFAWASAYNRASRLPGPVLSEWMPGKLAESMTWMLAASLATMIGYRVLARAPHRAWLGFAAVASLLFASALLIEPLTQSYASLGTSPVEARLAEAGRRVGIPRDRIVLQACVSADACPPGRVIGVGPTRLMVLNAASLRVDPEAWTQQTFAHEAKHFVVDDNIKAVLLLVCLSCLFAGSIHAIGGALASRCGARCGFSSLVEPASLPLIALLFCALQLAVLPPLNAYRQHVEREADRFALEMTRRNDVQGEMLAAHARGPLAVPESSRFAKWFRNSHPSDAERIRLANTYRPWAEGRSLRYAHQLRRVGADERTD
jgi:hypothetical protein